MGRTREGERVTSQYTIYGTTPDGHPIYISLALTDDRMIAVYRHTPGAMLITPHSVSHVVDRLRILQAEALNGITWR